MNNIHTLFFELIRVAIGVNGCLSKTPTNEEWMALYDLAKRQSLVGICFVGVHELEAQEQVPEDILYHTWMGLAAKVKQRNEVVNQRCVDLQKRLFEDRFRSCILKGQAVAKVYEGLSLFRQSGDVDIWVEGNRDNVLNYFEMQGIKVSCTSIKHAQVELYEDTEVEVHSRPSWFYNPFHDRRWMKWVKDQEEKQFTNRPVDGIVAPTMEFNTIFLLLHIYRHIFEEGVGLRQIMDYYFVLRALSSSSLKDNNIKKVLSSLGLMKFASATMYVLKEVFGLSEQLMICEPNEKDGRFLLEEIMRGGNFGKYDEGNRGRKVNRIVRGFATMKRNMRYISSYPSEILWAPIWKMWHWMWRRKHGYI